MTQPGAGRAALFPVSSAIFQLARTHRAYAADLLRPLDLFPGQEIILMALWEHGERTQSELVQLLRCDPSTVAKSLRRLETAGLVTRRTSERDRRASVVLATKKGKALQPKVEAAWRELERATVFCLDEVQQHAAVQMMQAIEARVERAAAASAG
jgi:DNA-binding MarR family transcriptional regulator